MSTEAACSRATFSHSSSLRPLVRSILARPPLGRSARTLRDLRSDVRVCIVGAGAIGGLVGARLADRGEHVSVLARGENLDAIRSNGLTIVEPDSSTLVDTGGSGVRRPRRPRPAGRDRARAQGPPDRRASPIAYRSLYDAGSVVVPMQNGVPWWFFQRFPGPYEGTTAADARPGRHVGAAHPARADRRLDPVSGRRTRRARRDPADRGRPLPGRRARRASAPTCRRDRRCAVGGRVQVAGADRRPRPPLGEGVGQSGVQSDQRADAGDAGGDLRLSRRPAPWRRR